MPAEQFGEPVTATIVAFLRSIGLDVRAGELHEPTFLPGIYIDGGALVVDPAQMRFPGDLLHEAGHLAVAAPERRATIVGDSGADAAEEMMAIAWSYAAAMHLQIDPAIVFHPSGYQGGGQSIIENFAEGRYFGVPMLQWVGMTFDDAQAKAHNAAPYPHMLQWLRPAAAPL